MPITDIRMIIPMAAILSEELTGGLPAGKFTRSPALRLSIDRSLVLCGIFRAGHQRVHATGLEATRRRALRRPRMKTPAPRYLPRGFQLSNNQCPKVLVSSPPIQ